MPVCRLGFFTGLLQDRREGTGDRGREGDNGGEGDGGAGEGGAIGGAVETGELGGRGTVRFRGRLRC
ncbi:hypothetical protein Shyd_85450 [Streptomyces hydrogenans]|uniref:Uncharacterized protein n=1 Tax=Streptomyces hydrogenans TaxID=1873719 RepID=A0ABQ3PQ87_9ACTN|nr:hypothetical protein GCM10018784_68780 [Streptomyces hydrogenans]GHI27174.1 hypothetical protein Shyd_85450 [Streptomyces hydrogenans]